MSNKVMRTKNADTATIVASAILLVSVASSLAGYTVQTQVEKTSTQIHYTWTVHNQDQSWGLDQFAIDVPRETRVLAHTVPPPYGNPDGNAYWVMVQTREAQVDPHDEREWLPAAKAGRKWIVWEGLQSPSVYPPGTVATFSLTTDASVEPGTIAGTAATYTPQTNPHYYLAFHENVTGPSAVNNAITSSDVTEPSLQMTESEFRSLHSIIPDLTGDSNQEVGRASLSIGLYPGLTIKGVVGQTYGIQYTTALGSSAVWRGLANITLSAPTQTWVDPQSASGPQRYYRAVQGPISIP